MRNIILKTLLFSACILCGNYLFAQEEYQFPKEETQTRWVSPENLSAEKGGGAKVNKGAKGNAFLVVAPGEKIEIFNVSGPGIIKRIWMSGTIARNMEQRRSVRIDMYWDGAKKPAVSAPIADFFGIGLGLKAPFESALFSSPEGRSYNCFASMPYRKSAKIEITNESSTYVLFWYDINFLKLTRPVDNMLYFHAYWNRTFRTELGKDFEILPQLNGRGRYLGSNIGVIGNLDYNTTWFGEGEVKVYLDGDRNLPTLVGTGTEDYIGTGWGQGVYSGQYQGSAISDKKNDLYSFYRYHIPDPIYFYKDCRVTIQQIGSAKWEKLKELQSKGVKIQPVWFLDLKGEKDITQVKGVKPEPISLLEHNRTYNISDSIFATAGFINFNRSDDVCATAYFYLDKPESNLPSLPSLEVRMQDMQSRVFDKAETQNK